MFILLEAVAANPALRLKEVSVLSETDMKMLSEFNATSVHVPSLLIHDHFCRKAQRVADKIAVKAGDI